MFNRNTDDALAAYYLRGAVGCYKFRVLIFDFSNFAHHLIIFFVGDDRSILLIIRCAPALDFLAEFIVGIDVISHCISVPFSVAAIVSIIQYIWRH